MMTPRDQISQDLSYFSGPSTSGAALTRMSENIDCLKICTGQLTNIVGSVAGRLQGVTGVSLLGEAEVCQL